MSEQLKYEWDFDVSKAEKQFNQWLSKAEARLADLGKKASAKAAKVTRDTTSGLDSRRRRRGEEQEQAQSARVAARKVEAEWKNAFAKIEAFRKRHPLISDDEINSAVAKLKRLQQSPAAQRKDFIRTTTSRTLEGLGDSNRNAMGAAAANRAAQAMEAAEARKAAAAERAAQRQAATEERALQKRERAAARAAAAQEKLAARQEAAAERLAAKEAAAVAKKEKALQSARDSALDRRISNREGSRDSEVRAAKELEAAYQRAYRNIENAARRAGVAGKRAAQEAKEAMKALRAMPIGRDVGRVTEYGRRKVIGVQDATAADSTSKQNRDKAIKEAQRASDAIARAQANAEAMVSRAALISAEKRQQLMAAAEQAITATVQAHAGKRVSVLQAELNRELASIRQRVAAEVEAAQKTQQAKMAGITRMNKMNMAMFAVQQGIEDFSFAGFRGLSNNLAMMASMLGGPAGLAAMAGMTAVSLGYMFSTMRSGDSVVEGHKDRLERLIEAHYDLEQARGEAFRDVSTRDTMDVAGSRRDTSRDIYDTNTAIKEQITLREELMTVQYKAQEARQLDKDINAMEWRIDTVGRGNMGVPQKFFDELERLEREKARALSEVSGIVGQPVTDLEQLAEAEKVAADRAGEASEEIENLKLELEKLGGLQEQAQALERFLKPLERLESFEMPNSFGDFGEFSGSDSLGRYASEYEKRITDAYENTVASRQEMDTESLDALQQKYGEALAAKDFDSAAAILKQQEEILQSQVDDLELLTKETTELVQLENERLTAIAEVQDLAGQVVSDLEDQIEKTKQLIRAEDERIEKLKEAKKESRESYGGKRFGMDKTLLDKRSEFEAERIKKRADAERKELEDFRKANKGNPQAEAWADAQERAIDRREERDLKRVEKKKEAAERTLYDDREALLSKRAEAEIKAAEEAQKAGDSALASKRYGKARDTLEELQSLQEEQVSSRSLPEAEAASGRADATQTRIEGVYDQEIAAAEQQKADEQAHLQELQTQLEVAKALKKEIESTPFVSEADVDAVAKMKTDLQEILAIKQQIAAAQAAAGDEFGLGGAPARAAGGPVTSGQTYLVGEKGPELFTAATSGSIHSTRDTMGILQSVASMYGRVGGDGASAITNNNTHFGTVNVQSVGAPNLEDLQRRAAWAAKSARIRQS